MVEQSVENLALTAVRKTEFGLRNPLKYFILSVMA